MSGVKRLMDERADAADAPRNRERSERLGRAVRERRRRLGITQDRVTANGGPSDRTIRGIENETSTGHPGRVTLRALDEGLFWDLGTAESVLEGVMAVGAAVDARQVARVRAAGGALTSGTAVALSSQDGLPIAESPAPEAAAAIEASGGAMTPGRARAAIASALGALLALPNPTDAEVEARDSVWDAMSILMEADRKER